MSASLKRIVGSIQLWLRGMGPGNRKMRAQRHAVMAELNTLSRDCEIDEIGSNGAVLVDGMWDNPNYWFRYCTLRRALSLSERDEIGLLGRHSRKQVKSSFNALGIAALHDLGEVTRVKPRHLEESKKILTTVSTSEDLLKIELPFGFPADHFYDHVLKTQRRSEICLDDPALSNYLAEAVAWLEASDNLLNATKPVLVVLSHTIGYTYGALAWLALVRGISVIALYGEFGTARFFRLQDPEDVYGFPIRPTLDELAALDDAVAVELEEAGNRQINARITGKTEDVGSVYAYQKRQDSVSREAICVHHGWDPENPIIAVYNSNWFDFPHGSGLREFRDFLDWIEVTLDVAERVKDVNWLFKAHPVDAWYGKANSASLDELVKLRNRPNMKSADPGWTGGDMIYALDGIVTCHGTIGVEAPILGTPVLVPYTGWYGHAGFVVCSENRTDYINKLQTKWWTSDINSQSAARFAGLYYSVPSWQKGYLLRDDSVQDQSWNSLPEILSDHQNAIDSETSLMKEWFESGHRYYHIYKNLRSEKFLTFTEAAKR